MSELINARTAPCEFRRRLLTTVSAAALIASVCGAQAADGDTARPTLWIELGGQLEGISGQGDAFAPPFVAAYAASPVFNPVSPVQAQNPPTYNFGGEGRISFQPDDSDWIFSASIRYGRSSNRKRSVFSTPGKIFRDEWPSYYGPGKPYYHSGQVSGDFAYTQVKQSESHAVIDFMAGKDFGLGMLGNGGTSTFNFGVRFAQFASSASVIIHAKPDVGDFNFWSGRGNYAARGYYAAVSHFHDFNASGHSSRSFRGVGPSVSWNASLPFAGNKQTAEVALNWGANAAVLFGKQKASGTHQTSGLYRKYGGGTSDAYQTQGSFNRVRSIVVPNLGGFAGLSVQRANAKISFGYRADFFFGAMDGGIDMRKSDNVGFYGPFATISVGIGG